MKTRHILLVEDNEGDVLLTQEAFEESQFDMVVEVARNGKEAMDHLYQMKGYEEKVQPDLILLDINLPLKSGHEVLVEIKNSEQLKRIPVVILTTSSSEKDVQKAYFNHANCFISKPVEINEFVDTIKSLVQFWFWNATLPHYKK